MTFSGIAACGRREAGGAYLDGLIAKYISDTYGLQVSSLTAERIKPALGAQGCGEAEMHILGKPQEQNGAREVLLHPAEMAGVCLLYTSTFQNIGQICTTERTGQTASC